MTRVISETNGVFGYTDRSIFHEKKLHTNLLRTIKAETGRSKEVFVKDFYSKYKEDYLPIWAMVEIVSFNTLSKLFASLKDPLRVKIIKNLDIKPSVFQSWLHTLAYVRNICAHHSRLWNKMLAIEPMIPKNQKLLHGLNNKKLFFMLTAILFILNKLIDDGFDFKKEVKALLNRYDFVDKDAMGFINNWEECEIWQ
jgi:abortive infection bacteriophage resistance protein